MKYVIVQGDGMGDRPDPAHGDTTPLQAAHTPHLDRVAGLGEFGMIHTIPEGYPPGSDVGNLSLFGYDPARYYTGRSPLEAAAMGVKLGPEDISFRMNMVTIADDGAMEDYSAGHIDSADAAALVETINESLADETFQFYPGVSYRHLLVWRNGQEQMTTTPPHDITGQPAAPNLPTGPGAEQLCRIMEASQSLFTDHPINRKRAAAGGKPVSQVWLWGQGRAPRMDPFTKLYGLKGACISAVDLVRGVAVNAGFRIIHVPGATGFLDTDYAAKGRYALDSLATHDLIFLHVEAPDEAGHMGDREEKIRAIESIDRDIIGPLLEGLPTLGEFKLMVASDHATPVRLRTHTSDPVPYAMVSSQRMGGDHAPVKYCEAEATRTGIALIHGHEAIRHLLDFC